VFEYVENEDHYAKVIDGIIRGAKYRLDIAVSTIKALTIIHGKSSEPIVSFLSRRSREGLAVRILHGGIPSEWFLRLLKKEKLPANGNLAFRRCPRVHQKTILSDGKLLYLGSANLTGAGIGAKSDNRRNFEAGIITDDLAIIDRSDSLFELIWCGDMCLKCGRKGICPSPLESPI
jgi:hypothetical protein